MQNEEMPEQEKSIKTPQKVDIIESFSNKISKASQFMIWDEFDICYDAKCKVVKQGLKNGKDLDNRGPRKRY